MPSKNARKLYIENGYYHIYNRGVEKRTIFEDEQDYSVFLSYLKDYLLPKDTDSLFSALSDPSVTREEKQRILKLLRLNNFSGSISMLAYCLMPSHFHLLIKQSQALTIDQFMNSLGTRYTMYFNRKYKRIGRLYQDVYKAVLVNNDEYLLHLSGYIHKQSFPEQGQALFNQPSSYYDYTGKKSTQWVQPNIILSYFSQNNAELDYSRFVTGANEFLMPSELLLEDE